MGHPNLRTQSLGHANFKSRPFGSLFIERNRGEGFNLIEESNMSSPPTFPNVEKANFSLAKSKCHITYLLQRESLFFSVWVSRCAESAIADASNHHQEACRSSKTIWHDNVSCGQRSCALRPQNLSCRPSLLHLGFSFGIIL